MPRPTIRALTFALALLATPIAHADGLADLRGALARLAAQTPLKATLAVDTLERHGSGKDLTEKSGRANLALEDGPRGVALVLPPDTLARMTAETQARSRDVDAKTPTLWALAKFEAPEAVAMASGATEIRRVLDEGEFSGEKPDTWQGRPARLLSFALPITRLTEVQRKYVKQFDGRFDLWIAADGTPLASATRESGSGRAFIVVSFDSRQDEDCTYGVVGDRLVTLRRETRNSGSGAGERGELRVTRVLQPQP